MLTAWHQGDWDVTCDSQGGRLTRVAWRGRELLTPVPACGAAGPAWGEFETRPVFGYDDCWPSLEVSAWLGRPEPVRDHGELCWSRWTLTERGEALWATASEPGDWTFNRTLSCVAGALRFDFAAANEGTRPLAMSWAGHALVPPASVLEMHLPPCEAVTQAWPEEPMVEAPAEAAEVWPFLRGLRGEAVMLVLERCATPALTLLLDGARWRLSFAGLPRPSLGLWANPGGYPPGRQREELGLEWMLTPECLLQDAAAHGNAIILAPGETCRWAVTWTLEETR